MRKLSYIFIILATVLSVGNLLARETQLAGQLYVRGAHAEIDGNSFIPSGPLSRALIRCHGLKVEVSGEAVVLDDHGDAPLFFVNEIKLYGEVKGSVDQFKTLFGPLKEGRIVDFGKETRRAFTIQDTVFEPQGPLADALAECTGQDLTLDTVPYTNLFVGGQTGLILRVVGFRNNRRTAIQAAKAEAWARYAEGHPPVNPEGPDGTYPRMRTMYVNPSSSRITVIMDTFGGIAAIGFDEVRYEFSAEGILLH